MLELQGQLSHAQQTAADLHQELAHLQVGPAACSAVLSPCAAAAGVSLVTPALPAQPRAAPSAGGSPSRVQSVSP